MEGKGVTANAAVFYVQSLDGGNLVGGKLEAENVEVLAHALHLGGCLLYTSDAADE